MIYLARRNPSIRPGDWPRTWRSHAVFASQFPSIGPSFSRVMYCSRAHDKSPAGATQEFDGAAVLSCPTEDALHSDLPADVRVKIDTDELRVFSTHVRHFTFRARESVADGADPTAAVVIRFLARKAGTGRDDFFARWDGAHADVARRSHAASGTVRRYVHNRLVEDPPPGYPFDGISETWFDDVEAAAGSLNDASLAAAGKDLEAFCETSRSVTLLSHVTHRWPRA